MKWDELEEYGFDDLLDIIKIAEKEEDLKKLLSSYSKDKIKSRTQSLLDKHNDQKLSSELKNKEITEKLNKIEAKLHTSEHLRLQSIKELIHSNTNIIAKNKVLNDNRMYMDENEYQYLREYASVGDVLHIGIDNPTSVIDDIDSVLPHERTECFVKLSKISNGIIHLCWNKDSSTADSIRVVKRDNSTSIALCDGAGSSGTPGKIYSRILSSIISEKIPLTLRSSNVFSSKATSNVIKKSLRDGDSKKKTMYSKLYRQIPHFEAQQLPKTITSGRSTALNVIIHADGSFWCSSIGDSKIFKIEKTDKYLINEIMQSSNLDSDGTELIGLGYNNNNIQFISELGTLKSGDLLIGMSDHAANYAMKHSQIFLSNIKNIINANLDKNEILKCWENLIKSINELTETDDDIAIFMIEVNEKYSLFEKKSITFTSSNQSYNYDKSKYELYKKNYYYDNLNRGLKKIPIEAASNLMLIKIEFEEIPPYIPNYEIYQTEDGNEYFIVMEHLSDEEYIRLDEAIYNFTNSEQIDDAISQILELKSYIETYGIYHCDIAPTNIFLSRSKSGKARIVDLNTLYIDGCFPLSFEMGHQGMFGSDSPGYIPSRHIHKFPFNVILFTLQTIRSQGNDIAMFVSEFISKTADEVYILEPDFLRSVYNDDSLNRFDEHLVEIKSKFPQLDEVLITEFLKNNRQCKLFEL